MHSTSNVYIIFQYLGLTCTRATRRSGSPGTASRSRTASCRGTTSAGSGAASKHTGGGEGGALITHVSMGYMLSEVYNFYKTKRGRHAI